MGINISGVNTDHLPKEVRDNRTTEEGSTLNFIECVIDEDTKQSLFLKLRTQYGAIDVKKHDGIINMYNMYSNYALVPYNNFISTTR